MMPWTKRIGKKSILSDPFHPAFFRVIRVPRILGLAHLTDPSFGRTPLKTMKLAKPTGLTKINLTPNKMTRTYDWPIV